MKAIERMGLGFGLMVGCWCTCANGQSGDARDKAQQLNDEGRCAEATARFGKLDAYGKLRGAVGGDDGGIAGPGNDACGSATAITGNGPFSFSNTTATTDGTPPGNCPQISNDLWYCWTANCTGNVTPYTCDQMTIDSVMAVYNGCTCPPDDFSLLACNDDQCNVQSGVTFAAVSGNHYLIRIGGYDEFALGSGTFRIRCPDPARGGCCVGAGLSNCVAASASECAAQSGTFLGLGSSCSGVYSTGPIFVLVPDGPGGEVTVPLNVADSDVIDNGELNVGVLFRHTWQGDVSFYLTSPGGTTVTLVDRPNQPQTTFGFSNDNYGNPNTGVKFVLKDGFPIYDGGTAGVPIDNPTGNWGPEQPLSSLAGQNFQGTWTLRVTDEAGADVGILLEWCLIRKNAAATCPPANPCQAFLRGDGNGDGALNNFDIDPFVLALTDLPSYRTAFCGGNAQCAVCRIDVNRDGSINNFDIDPFVACLTNMPPGCP